MAANITWLGHASFKINTEGLSIYIDPWKIEQSEKADLVLITHSHFDHLSAEDVKKIHKETTDIVVTKDGASKVKGKVKGVEPDQDFTLQDIRIKTVPAYNIDKPHHPREKGWVGYIIQAGGISIYHSGDTDLIPEMEKINPYLALLPIGGTYTMDVEEALEAAHRLNPHIAIPMHYGDIVGSSSDGEKFAEECEVEVKLLRKKESVKVDR